MQQVTTLRTTARTTATRRMVPVIAALALLVMVGLLGLSPRAPRATPVAVVVVNPVHNRLFDGEMRYVASASEYAALPLAVDSSLAGTPR